MRRIWIFAAEEEIVGDEEVSRAGILRPHAYADVFEAAVAHGESDGAHHFLLAGEDSYFGVAEGETFEDVVLTGDNVEELVISRAVENCFAVARAFDGDRLLGRALQRKRPVTAKGALSGST
jgi:hypothetical protein